MSKNQAGGSGLTVPFEGTTTTESRSLNSVSPQAPPHISLQNSEIGSGTAPSSSTREKLLITGDDVLIEYVHRLMIAVQSIKEVMLKPQWKN